MYVLSSETQMPIKPNLRHDSNLPECTSGFFKLGLGRSIQSLIILIPKLLLVSDRYFSFTSSSTLSGWDQRTDTSSHLAFHPSLLSCLLLCCHAVTWLSGAAKSQEWHLMCQRESGGQSGVILLQPTKILLFLFYVWLHQLFLKVKIKNSPGSLFTWHRLNTK